MSLANCKFVFVFLFLAWAYPSTRLTAQVLFFRDTACLVTARPIPLTFGQQVVIECDTAWLINAGRYRLYEQARNYLLGMKNDAGQEIIRSFELTLEKTDGYFRDIRRKYDLLSRESQRIQEENRTTLQQVNRDLAETQTSLQATKKELESVTRSLKRDKRRDRLGKIAAGTAGLGLGLLTGLVIFK